MTTSISCDSIKWRYEHLGFSSSANQLSASSDAEIFLYFYSLSVYMAPKHRSHFSPKHPDSHVQSGDVRIIIMIPYLQKWKKKKVFITALLFQVDGNVVQAELSRWSSSRGSLLYRSKQQNAFQGKLIKSAFGGIQKCAREYMQQTTKIGFNHRVLTCAGGILSLTLLRQEALKRTCRVT